VSAAARHFIDRFFPGDYKVIPNGVDADRFQRAVPLTRWRAILFVGLRKGRDPPAPGVPDPARGTPGSHRGRRPVPGVLPSPRAALGCGVRSRRVTRRPSFTVDSCVARASRRDLLEHGCWHAIAATTAGKGVVKRGSRPSKAPGDRDALRRPGRLLDDPELPGRAAGARSQLARGRHLRLRHPQAAAQGALPRPRRSARTGRSAEEIPRRRPQRRGASGSGGRAPAIPGPTGDDPLEAD
jgi:hypothetical protein